MELRLPTRRCITSISLRTSKKLRPVVVPLGEFVAQLHGAKTYRISIFSQGSNRTPQQEGERACALDNGYGAARGTCESFCKFKCFFCWDKTHLFNCFTALADIGDLAWLKASFLDARGILMNDQATNWAGRELNLHWGFDELRADRAIHPMDLQGAPKATCVALANSR